MLMIEMIRNIYRRFYHLILYGMIGSFSSGLDFVIYSILVKIVGLQYLVANCISIFAGISTSFILNRNYNFKIKDKLKLRFIIFLSTGLSGLVLSNIILYLCISKLDMNALISKLFSIAVVVFFQFLVNKNVTFKPYNNE